MLSPARQVSPLLALFAIIGIGYALGQISIWDGLAGAAPSPGTCPWRRTSRSYPSTTILKIICAQVAIALLGG